MDSRVIQKKKAVGKASFQNLELPLWTKSTILISSLLRNELAPHISGRMGVNLYIARIMHEHMRLLSNEDLQ